MRAYVIALQLMIRKVNGIDDDDDDDVNNESIVDEKDDNTDNSDDDNNKNHTMEKSNKYGRHHHDDDDDSENWSDDSSSVNSVSHLNPALGLGASSLQKKRFNIDRHDHNIDTHTRLIGIGLGNDDNLTASVSYWVDKIKESKIYNITKPYSTDDTKSTDTVNDSSINANATANIPRWNYFIQRSYLNYIKTWPLYGIHLAKGFLVKGDDDDETEVLIGLSGRGLYILNSDTWNLIFKCPGLD
jgi:hypothetical protein